MMAYVFSRLLQSMFVLLTVALISFCLFRFAGDPVNNIVGQDATLAEREALREELGLNDPILVQFGHFAGDAVRGEFGLSYVHKQPVSKLIAERFPATIELALLSTGLALLLGIPVGVYTAIRRNSVVSHLLMALSLVGISLPTFLVAILFILQFGVILQWLPTFGRGEVVTLGWWTTGLLTVSGMKALILPSATLALFQSALIVRVVRAEMLEVLGTDYIRFGRARGLGWGTLYFRHALKNTLIPVITIIGLQFGSVIAFAIITESVFQWPGMGLLFIQAVANADVPVMSAYLVLVGLIFVTVNLLADVLYVYVDPRLRRTSDGGGTV